MRKAIHHILILFGVYAMLSLTACDVHEFPEPPGKRVPYTLYLDFNESMPLYTIVDYVRGDETDAPRVSHDMRYIVKAYREDMLRSEEGRIADTTFIFTQSDILNPNRTLPLELHEGNYELQIWTDYVDVGKTEDKYYITNDFSKIRLPNEKNHVATTEYREAFRGYASVKVVDPEYYAGADAANIQNRDTVYMSRPMGRYEFIATDLELFLTRYYEMMKEQGKFLDIDAEPGSRAIYEQILKSINLNEYKVIFRYNPFMPCSFNMFKDRPNEVWEYTSFEGKMTPISETEMSLGFDYIFVNGTETTLSIYFEIYDKDGKLMSSSNPVDVPIVRNKETLVRGEFLTSKASEGVSINPGFDGDDYNLEIK